MVCSIQIDDGISYYGRYVSHSGTKPKICKKSNDRNDIYVRFHKYE